jgi:hypothetical protein
MLVSPWAGSSGSYLLLVHLRTSHRYWLGYYVRHVQISREIGETAKVSYQPCCTTVDPLCYGYVTHPTLYHQFNNVWMTTA